MKHLFCRLSVVGRHCRSINSVSRGKSWHGATVTQDKVLSRKAAPHSHLLQGTVRRETLREPCFVFLRLCARFRSDSRNLTKREKTEREREGGREGSIRFLRWVSGSTAVFSACSTTLETTKERGTLEVEKLKYDILVIGIGN